MGNVVKTIKALEINKLKQFLDENPSKKNKLKAYFKEKEELTKEYENLKVPVKNYGNFGRILKTEKYKEYIEEKKQYEILKSEIWNNIVECEKKILETENSNEIDENRNSFLVLIPLLEEVETIEDLAYFAFYTSEQERNANKQLIALALLFQNLNYIKTEHDINDIYDSLDFENLNDRLEDLNLLSLTRSLKRIKIEIDEGFYQFISMIINEKTLCNQYNLMTTFPILKQLKEDKQVPKNIRVALDILDDQKNEERLINEVGHEILIKEILYKVKENQNV